VSRGGARGSQQAMTLDRVSHGVREGRAIDLLLHQKILGPIAHHPKSERFLRLPHQQNDGNMLRRALGQAKIRDIEIEKDDIDLFGRQDRRCFTPRRCFQNLDTHSVVPIAALPDFPEDIPQKKNVFLFRFDQQYAHRTGLKAGSR